MQEDRVSDAAHQQHDAVSRARYRRLRVFSHPCRDERHEREPEEQVQIGPHRAARDPLRGVQQVMMIVPIDPQENEAQDVRVEGRQQRPEAVPVWRFRGLQFQHHDRDDHGDHAIAEGLEPSLCHAAPRMARAT